jgi:hypothetical protein
MTRRAARATLNVMTTKSLLLTEFGGSVSARFGYRECGRTPGYPHGHDDIHLLKLLG